MRRTSNRNKAPAGRLAGAIYTIMKHIYIPTTSPEDWRKLLASPEKHWRRGYSARELAERWEGAAGFPPEVQHLFARSGIPALQKLELLLAIPEYQVPLPGGSRPSQNDLFALARTDDDHLVVLMVEGKVNESFGPTLGDWLRDASSGKRKRLAFLCEQLGIPEQLPPDIRYQLLHRTVSALLTARKFTARYAVMLVHSFSQECRGLGDYQTFLGLFGAQGEANDLVVLSSRKGILLYAGWATGASSKD